MPTPLLSTALVSGALLSGTAPAGAPAAGPDLDLTLPTVPLSAVGIERPAPAGLPRTGHLRLAIEGRPGDRVLLALVPDAVANGWCFDDPSALWIVDGLTDPTARIGTDGTYLFEHYVPGELPAGMQLTLQALTFDELSGPTGVSPALELTLETRFEFDFLRTSGGWTALDERADHGDGWEILPDGSIARALGGLEADTDYQLEVRAEVAPEQELLVGAGASAARIRTEGPWTSLPADGSPAELGLSTGGDGHAWIVLGNPSETPSNVHGLRLTVRRRVDGGGSPDGG